MSVGLFFDCDGVLIDSNALKTEAFRTVGRLWDEQAAEALVRYHVDRGGISRFEKFRHFFEAIYPVPDAQGEIDRAVNAYAREVRTTLLQCPTVPGIERALEAAVEAGAQCWVVSGGAEEEVRWVLERKGLGRFFEGIFGAPPTKAEIVASILQARRPYSSMVFFGDSASDFRTAVKFGMDFVFVRGYSEWSGPSEKERGVIARVEDFDAPEMWVVLTESFTR